MEVLNSPYRSDRVKGNGQMMKIAAAVQRGTGHLAQGLPCQDCAVGWVSPSCAVVVLCDGAGSRANSHRAAQCLCDWASVWLAEMFDALYDLDRPAVAAYILREGLAQLDTLGMEPDECLCTFLAFARHADGRWLLAHIGDGYILAPDEVLSHPENGRYANETYFFSEPRAAEHLRIAKGCDWKETAVLLTSDGCGDSLYDRETDRPVPAVRKLCLGLAAHTSEEARQALAYNLSQVFAARSDDDLSLALLWCPAPEPVDPDEYLERSGSE